VEVEAGASVQTHDCSRASSDETTLYTGNVAQDKGGDVYYSKLAKEAQ
jgi:hypothetical protein